MNSMKLATAQWTAVSIAMIVWTGLGQPLARADESTSPQSAAQEPQLAEIVVTAEKRSERLQDVPLAVSALSGATLQAMGAETFTDYARSIPGLTFTDLGGGRQIPSIRGINPSAGEGTVGYYIDETPIAGIEGEGIVSQPTLIDINRIEVLRGPQGTLYGSSSIGGTIKLIPNAPNLTSVEGSVKVEAQDTQGANGASPGEQSDLVLNVPIVQGFAALRTALWDRDVGGFIDRTWTNTGANGIATGPVVGTVGNLPDEHTWGFRTAALFQPVEQLKISAMVYHETQHLDGFTDITGGAGNPNDQLVQNFISDTPEPQVNDISLYNLTVKYAFGRFNVVSSTSYMERVLQYTEESTSLIQLTPAFFGDPVFDGTFPSVGTFRQTANNFSQEVRLATSRPVAGFDGLVGGYFANAHNPRSYDQIYSQYDEDVVGNNPADPAYAPDGNLYSAWGPGFRERQIAAFGELTYHFTDALDLTGGVRHYDVSNRFQLYQDGLFIGGNAPGLTTFTDESSRAEGNVYKGNLSYKLTSEKLLYAQFSEGFRPGFGNSALPSECPATSYQLQVNPDSIKNYEIGAKTDWLNRRLTINGAAYRINWTDIQQGELLPCGFGVAENFGSAVIKGAELEASAQVTRRVTAGLSATYLHTQLVQPSPVLGALAGDPIEFVPNSQYALYAQTTFPIREASDGFARVDYQYTGHSIANYTRLSNGSFDPEDEVQVVRMLNARIGENYHAWEFALSATNLLNDEARQSIDPNASITVAIPGRPRYVVTRPRTFSLSAAYDF